MSAYQSIILGIVQGVAEFLPISSSAHLIIFPYLFGWRQHSLSFDVMLHLGTLSAILIYFWRDWLKLVKSGLFFIKERSAEGRLFWYIVFATIPAAVCGKLLEDKAEIAFRNPLLAASVLGVFGIIFYLAQNLNRNKKTLEALQLKDAVLIGIAQSLAIIPGVSRSGATIASALALNFNKEAAVRFSFLLSFPVILGAGILKFKDIFSPAASQDLSVHWAGFIASAVSGFLSIHFLLKFIKKHSFSVFIYYRLVIAVITIIVFIFKAGT